MRGLIAGLVTVAILKAIDCIFGYTAAWWTGVAFLTVGSIALLLGVGFLWGAGHQIMRQKNPDRHPHT